MNLTSMIYGQQALFTNFNTTLFTNLNTAKFWKVGNGVAITLNYCNTKNETKNLFIDGGYPVNYLHTIKKEILDIQSADRHINLWITQNFPSCSVTG